MSRFFMVHCIIYIFIHTKCSNNDRTSDTNNSNGN